MPGFFNEAIAQLSKHSSPLTGRSCDYGTISHTRHYEIIKTLNALSLDNQKKKKITLNYIFDASPEDLSFLLTQLEDHSDISHLTIRFANLASEHVGQLLRIINKNPDLIQLDLSVNKFILRDLRKLATAIKQCKKLISCDIWGNPVLTALKPYNPEKMTQSGYDWLATEIQQAYGELARELDQHCVTNLKEDLLSSHSDYKKSEETVENEFTNNNPGRHNFKRTPCAGG